MSSTKNIVILLLTCICLTAQCWQLHRINDLKLILRSKLAAPLYSSLSTAQLASTSRTAASASGFSMSSKLRWMLSQLSLHCKVIHQRMLQLWQYEVLMDLRILFSLAATVMYMLQLLLRMVQDQSVNTVTTSSYSSASVASTDNTSNTLTAAAVAEQVPRSAEKRSVKRTRRVRLPTSITSSIPQPQSVLQKQRTSSLSPKKTVMQPVEQPGADNISIETAMEEAVNEYSHWSPHVAAFPGDFYKDNTLQWQVPTVMKRKSTDEEEGSSVIWLRVMNTMKETDMKQAKNSGLLSKGIGGTATATDKAIANNVVNGKWKDIDEAKAAVASSLPRKQQQVADDVDDEICNESVVMKADELAISVNTEQKTSQQETLPSGNMQQMSSSAEESTSNDVKGTVGAVMTGAFAGLVLSSLPASLLFTCIAAAVARSPSEEKKDKESGRALAREAIQGLGGATVPAISLVCKVLPVESKPTPMLSNHQSQDD